MRNGLFPFFLVLLLSVFVVCSHGAFGVSQETVRFYSDPIGVESLHGGEKSSFIVNIDAPDVGKVVSGIVEVDFISYGPAVFWLYIDGFPCTTEYVKTDVSPKTLGSARFDCSNIIDGVAGSYDLVLIPDTDVGPTGLLVELSYWGLEQPVASHVGTVDRVLHIPSMTVAGTDYEPGDNAKVFVILADAGIPQDNGTCIVQIFYPNSSEFLDYTQMTFLEDGIYYYDFTAPDTIGVYPVEVRCSYVLIPMTYNVSTATRLLGAGAGALSNLNLIDGNYWGMNENAGDVRRVAAMFNFTGVNGTLGGFSDVNIHFTGSRPQLGGDPASDNVTFWMYDYNLSKYVKVASDFSYLASDTTKNYHLVSNVSHFISSSGQMSVLVNDTVNTTDGDGANSILSIDQLTLSIVFTIPNSSVTNVAGGGELNIRRHFADLSSQIQNISINSSLGSVNGNLSLIQQTLAGIGLNVSLIGGNLSSLIVSVDLNSQNVTSIKYTVESINANISGQNLTAINDSLSNLIITTSELPMKFDLTTVLLILLIVFMIVCLFYSEPGMLLLTGIYAVIFGVYMITGVNPWVGIVIVGIGAAYGVGGYLKLNRN